MMFDDMIDLALNVDLDQVNAEMITLLRLSQFQQKIKTENKIKNSSKIKNKETNFVRQRNYQDVYAEKKRERERERESK